MRASPQFSLAPRFGGVRHEAKAGGNRLNGFPSRCRRSSLLAPATVLLALLAQPALAQTTNEAELATLANGAKAEDCSWCSGGKRVVKIGGENNGTVTFNHFRVARAGLYPVRVYFHSGDDRAVTFTVNTNAQFDCILHPAPRSPGQTVLLPLKAGENVVEVSNAYEPGPDLDYLVLEDTPVESFAVSGTLKSTEGTLLAGVEVRLTGDWARLSTLTDARGHYEFACLPSGNYYVRPAQAGAWFSPYEQACPALTTNATGRDFTQTTCVTRHQDLAVMKQGKWRIEYDLGHGVADVFCGGKLLLPRAFAVARLPETVTSRDYRTRKVLQEPIQDAFGRGMKYVVESANGSADRMLQTFWLYPDADYLLTEVTVARAPAAASSFLAPLVSETPAAFLPTGDRRALFVPFDNDKWIRYAAVPFGQEVTSYEVSALYDNTSRQGLVLGSIDHDTWKSAVVSATSGAVTRLALVGGVASCKTRDLLPHGQVTGPSIHSPRFFIGYFPDWRDGLQAYAKANATVSPPLPWTNGVPFGWNSWGKLQFHLTFQKALEVSDFFARELQSAHFQNDGLVYIGLDSGWNKFTEDELRQFVDRCHTNHQEAGIYFTPFTAWHENENAAVPGTAWKYKDLFLYAHGRRQHIASGVALDPTHPGTQKLIADVIGRFKQAGFKYLKADFLNYGCLEADHFYDPQVTTGIQAYNAGMKFIAQTIGNDLYLNLSIAPVFPAQYAQSRRIACDAFGGIGETEYTLNSLAYGWWLSGVYDFNDPDEIVLDGFTESENRARITSAVITGLFICGDDFSQGGSALGKQRAKQLLTNADIDELARSSKSFRPVEGNTGAQAAQLFACEDRDGFYLAAFNYARTSTDLHVDLARLGLKTRKALPAKELWSGAITEVSRSLTIHLGPTDAAVYKIYTKGTAPKLTTHPSRF